MDAWIGTSATEGYQLPEEEMWAQQPVEAEEEAKVDVCLELLVGKWGGDYASRKFEGTGSFCCGGMLK